MQKKKVYFYMHRLCLLIACLLFLTGPLLAASSPHSLRDRLVRAEVGDFAVTAQEGNYSLLFVRSIAADSLLLEEVSVPARQIDLKKTPWKKWLSEKAPGHTSWTLYEIELPSGRLVECFSVSKNSWIFPDGAEQFLTRLLTLPLTGLPEEGRKRIGPPPAAGEIDRRAFWVPPLTIEGKKIDKPLFDVWKTEWPDDRSPLALCPIILYFAKEYPTFPFWLEVQSPHYTFKMRAIDAGKGMISPLASKIPHRFPEILGAARKEKTCWKLPVKIPPRFERFHLFATDVTGGEKQTLPIPFSQQKAALPEESSLEISVETLKRTLTPGHRYRWVLIPEAGASIHVESDEIFSISNNL